MNEYVHYGWMKKAAHIIFEELGKFFPPLLK